MLVEQERLSSSHADVPPFRARIFNSPIFSPKMNPPLTLDLMSWFYRTLVRPALFTQESEEIHNRTLSALGRISRHESLCDGLAAFFGAPELPITTFGLHFPNPVGLAAGMDKHAAAAPVWPALGFGFSELGGVTWHAQPGNPAPRMFRAIEDEALVNRMGFNNPGAEAVARRLAEWRSLGRWPRHPVGINLGKSQSAPLEQAAEDYASSLRLLWSHADFFVVNVSSPNTPNLRQLQDKAALDEILAALQEVNRKMAGSSSATKPILVKVAPDLSFEALDEIVELAGPRSLAGIVATNTTVARPPLAEARLQRVYAETGGLSGQPLRTRSTEVVRHLYRQSKGMLPIIGVGGIFRAADAWEKITAGATLIQVYTGLVYEGPSIAREITSGLQARMKERGLTSLSQAVGIDSSGSGV
jgi:dihydroorotate dehydrogenase